MMNNPEARLFDHTHKLLRAHEAMLRDAVRNRAFYNALKRRVSEDSIVLDIGAGTGIWAITAAKLGAKRVVAVEPDELLIGLIKNLAEEHNVGKKVEIVCGKSFDVRLEKEFDLVVSETVGYLGFEENIVEIMRDARTRFLKKDGAIIPEIVALAAAAAHLKTETEIVPSGLPFDFAALADLNLHSPRTVSDKRDLQILSEPQRLVEINLNDANENFSLENLRAKWRIENAASVNCFVVWVESLLTEGVNLSTRETTSWLPNIFRIEPFAGNFNEIEFEISLTTASSYWTATFADSQNRQTKKYSPEFAATKLTMLSRGGDSLLLELLNRH